eukprot:363933-Chlamydomonas_euryale.AAC.3
MSASAWAAPKPSGRVVVSGGPGGRTRVTQQVHGLVDHGSKVAKQVVVGLPCPVHGTCMQQDAARQSVSRSVSEPAGQTVSQPASQSVSQSGRQAAHREGQLLLPAPLAAHPGRQAGRQGLVHPKRRHAQKAQADAAQPTEDPARHPAVLIQGPQG